jgi:hypothetical protein
MPPAQGPGHDVRHVVRGDAAPQRGPQRAEHRLAGFCHRPDDDHALGAEQVAHGGQLRADQPGGVADHAHRARVAVREQLHQPGERQPAVLGPQRIEDGGDGGVAVEAAALAAAAQRSALVHGDVADLPGAAGGAAHQGPVHEQPASDAVVELDRHAVIAALSGAPDMLAERGQVRVVVDAHRDAEDGGDVAAGHALPAGEDLRRLDHVRTVPDGPGQRDPRPDQGVIGKARRGQRLFE